MKVSILIAASGRSFMLRDMLISLKSTVGLLENMETIFVIDDDISSFQYATEFPTYSGQVIDYSPTRRGALWAWNRALQLSSGDLLVPAGDDQIFHPDWLKFALESHKEELNGSGVVGMNDLAYDGNKQLATMFLFDRQYCRDYMGGVFAPPMYQYYNIDSEWNAKAKLLDKFFWDSNAIVEHLHVAHGKRKYDENDRIKDESGWMEIDNKVFEERKEKGFPVIWDSII